jgi:hypothetical protein
LSAARHWQAARARPSCNGKPTCWITRFSG